MWKELLDQMEPFVATVAGELGGQVSREHGDAPALSIHWYADGDLGHALQLVIVGDPGSYSVAIHGSAWKDYSETRERRWTTAFLDRWEPIFKNNGRQFTEDLRAVAKQVVGWSESDLDRSDTLPPRPSGLTPQMVSGRFVS